MGMLHSKQQVESTKTDQLHLLENMFERKHISVNPNPNPRTL